MRYRNRFGAAAYLLVCLTCCQTQSLCCGAETRAPFYGDLARQVFRETGVQGGLVVHVGCGEGGLAAALGAEDRCVVHALAVDEKSLASARRHIQSLGLYGKVSVDRFRGGSLPYVDNLVNLLVAEDMSAVSMDQVMRVLAPGGVAYVHRGGTWTKTVKPRPGNIDEWTHWLHDPSGNAVGRDTVAGPPRHYQWTASQPWSQHHDTVLTTSAMVTAGGRIFAITNEAPTSEFHDRSQGNWFLVARDAFNGVLLWKRPVRQWGWQAWGESFAKRFAQPIQLPSRLVALGDRVYVTLGFHAPVSALDAATGEILTTYENTRHTDEILLHEGKLIVTVYDPNDERTRKTIRVIDPVSGAAIWQSGPHVGLPARYDAVEGWDPLYVTAYRDRLAFVTKDHVVCLNLDDGRQRWCFPRPAYQEHRMNLGVRQSENCSLVHDGEIVLYTQPVGRLPHTNHTVACNLVALSADTGTVLWKTQCGVWAWGHQADVFVIDDLVWVHEHIPTEMEGPEPVGKESIAHTLLGLDVGTGDVVKRIPTTDIFHIGHHHRCYRNKATTRYVFTARRGTETTELDTGQLGLHPWVRSECRFGILPANGLLYMAPHPCACYAGVSLTGYNALAATRDQRSAASDESDRLLRGPAYDQDFSSSSDPAISPPDDWPTHRQNAGRSGFAPTEISTEFRTDWQCRLDAPLSAATVSENRVYVAEKERNALVALDAETGEVLWRFITGGRIDSPPTVSHGRAVFGCRDGWVYCLSAAQGSLVWRFRAAPSDLRLMAENRLESVWPVHGSVLVQNDEVVAAAGRSSYLDGGLHAYRLDLATGQVVEDKRISHEHLTERKVLESQTTAFDHYYTDGAVSDLLSARDRSVFLKVIPVFGGESPRGPILAAQSGFLDASAFERSFWYLVRPDQPPIGAQLIVHDADTAFGFRAYDSPQRGGPWHVLGTGYTLFAVPCGSAGSSNGAPQPNPRHVPAFTSKLARAFTWKQQVSVRARAMVLTENALLLAGSPDLVKPDGDPFAALDGELGGELLVISREHGTPLADYDLGAPPVWDGMAVAAGSVYIVGQNGTVTRMGPSARTSSRQLSGVNVTVRK